MEKEFINDLIIRYLLGECSGDENQKLLEWSKLSDENADYLQKFKYAWIASNQLGNEQEFAPGDDLLTRLHHSYANEKQVETFNIETSRFIIRRILKYVALILIIFSVGWLSSRFVSPKADIQNNSLISVYETPVGSKGIVTLPDGTQVWLNAGSKLSYPASYNQKERIVKLEGEGYFDVVTNPKKPFIVKARDLNIKAYGTSFNVKAYNDEKEVITTLVKGKVFIEGRRNHKEFLVEMKPQQTIKYMSEKALFLSDSVSSPSNPVVSKEAAKVHAQAEPFISRESKNTEIYTSWKDERWIVEKVKITDFIRMLERRYNVVFVMNPDDFSKYHFSGTIENESIEQVLSFLRYTLPIKYNVNKNHIQLKLDQELTEKYNKAL